MSDSARDLLVRGIAAAKAQSMDEARFFLEQALALSTEREQRAKALIWLSEISDDPDEKREHLENALAYEPFHPLARRRLAVLEGRLDPREIVDPDRIPVAEPEAPKPIHARRFVCQQCGGRMAFTPDGKALTCAYCGQRQSLLAAINEGAMVEEQDFVVTMATAKGHNRPAVTQTLACQGCGASFVLGPKILSSKCPYCASVYVVERADVRELIPPEGVIPFTLTEEQAGRALLEWLKEHNATDRVRASRPKGVYFPVWTFDLGGDIPWRCLEREGDNWVPRSGIKVVYEDDLVVPASHTLPAALSKEVDGFRLGELMPYDPGYLADWPAEVYEISVSDASLVARHRALAAVRAYVERSMFGRIKDYGASSTRLVVESFKLVLLPFWAARYQQENELYTVVVNGQTGAVRGERPERGMRRFLSWLTGGR